MTTKRCSICKKTKDTEKFNKNVRKKDNLQTSCKVCSAKRSAAYYKRKTEHHKKVTKKQRAATRARNSQFIWDYLLQHPCVDCKESDPMVLEFDHLRDKVAAVSGLVSSASIECINQEIDKCEVRCANCHRRKTAIQLGWYKNINTGP